MKRFIYLILFLILLLTLKAFYLDPYLSEKFGDTNQSTEANSTTETNQSDTTSSAPLAPEHSTQHEKMPLDKLGDSIADKLEDKIGKQ